MAIARTTRDVGSAVATGLGCYAFCGGLISFLGWPLDVPRLTDWFNADVSIQPNACLLMALSGAGLVLAQQGATRAVGAVGSLVGIGGLFILLQYVVGADFGFNDLLLFGRAWGQGTTLTPGRVGPPASLSFALIGLALVLLARAETQPGRADLRRFVPLTGVAISIIVAFSLLGYLFEARDFYTIPWLSAIALQTATMLLALGLGLILSVPEQQPMLLLRERSGAGALARIAFPILIVMIPSILWLRVWGYEQGHYDIGTGRTLGALVLMVGTAAVLWIALLALRRGEQALRDSEIRHRTLFEVAVHGVITIDEQGIIESANPAAERLFGYTSSELVGRNVSILMPDPYRSEHDGYLNNYRQTGVARIIGIGREVVGRRKDGSTFPMDLAVSELQLGKKHLFTGIVVDVSERKQAEESLRDADRRKDEFLATLAHELRNPLAPLMNGVSILDRAGSDQAVADTARATMRRQMKHLVRLIDDLLDVSRISRGTIEVRKESVELASLVQQAVESISSTCDAQQQQLVVNLPTEPVWVNADPVRLVQIIGNLLSNASRYSAAGTRIELRASCDGNDVVVTVKDQGTGIPPEKLESIFEMFSQIDRSLERAAGGLGIGLYLVRRLAQLHGGTATAHSDGQHSGSEFVVRLPIVSAPPGATDGKAPPKRDAATAAGRRASVLVVDDNPDAATTLAILLRAHGYPTQMVHDGLQAVEAAEQLAPDIILLDIGLPGLNGYDVCERVRQLPWGNQMVLIALTGRGQEEDRRRSKECGFDAHVVKPVEAPELERLLVELLAKRHLATLRGATLPAPDAQ